MSNFIVQRTCRLCSGEGASPATCPVCGGTNVHEFFTIIPPTNIFHSHEILEVLDATEYSGLGAGAVAGLNTLLSCGLVDLNDGKAGKTRLWNWFGAESTTVANLTAILE